MKIWREKDKELNNWVWKADFWYKKKKYRPQAFSKNDLERKIISIRTKVDRIALGLDSEKTVTLKQLLEKHAKELGTTDKNKMRGRRVCEAFVKKAGANLLVTELTDAEFYDYVRARKDKRARDVKQKKRSRQLSPGSINKELYFILKMLKSAPRYFRDMKGYVAPLMPWEKLPRESRDRVIADDEREKLLNYLRFEGRHGQERVYSKERRFFFGDMFEIALNTAMRWGEIARLDWSFIFLEKRIIKLPKEMTKTGVSRVVYLNSRSIEILNERKAVSKSNYVFPSFDGDGFEKFAHFAFQRYCAKLGLDFSLNGFTLHTTRHTAVTEMLDRSGDFAGTQAQAGHSDRTMTSRYAHAKKSRMFELVENLVEK